MLKWTILGLIAVAILIEGGIFIGVISWIGVLPGLGWVVVSFLLGVFLLRLEGINLLFQVHRQLQAGVVPTRELVDGAAILLGAIFLISPGFFTDGVGLVLLLRPLRWLLVNGVMRTIAVRRPSGRWEFCFPSRRPPPEVIEIQAEPQGDSTRSH